MAVAAPLLRSWDPMELAWLAGLYEGEGCLSQQSKTKHCYWVLCITMTDEDVVRRAYEIGGTGSFIGPMSCPSLRRYKPTYRWVVNAQQHIHVVTGALFPFLGARRQSRILDFQADYFAKETQRLCRNGLHPKLTKGRCAQCTEITKQRYIAERAESRCIA